MKTKYIEIPKNIPPFDLFGEISVTFDEILIWCCFVSHGDMTPKNRYFEQYVRNYDVANKIRRTKMQFYTLENFMVAAANDDYY